MTCLRNFSVIFILIFFNSMLADAQKCQSPTIEQEVCSNQADIPVCACDPLFGTTPYFTAPNSDGTCRQGCHMALPSVPAEEDAQLTYTCSIASYLIKDILPAQCESGCMDRGISQWTEQTGEKFIEPDNTGVPLFHVCCVAKKTRVCATVTSPIIFGDPPEEEGQKPEEEKPENNKQKPPLFSPGPDDIG